MSKKVTLITGKDGSYLADGTGTLRMHEGIYYTNVAVNYTENT